MRSGNRSNALLVELLIVVLFFMLASTVLLQVFTAARNMSEKSGWISRALTEAQNVTERLSVADAPEAELTHMGFDRRAGEWVLQGADYEIRVALTKQQTDSGILHRQQVQVLHDGEQLLLLPGARYQEVRP